MPILFLLQEVGSIPDSVTSVYSVLDKKAVRKNGQPQRFSTAVLVKEAIDRQLVELHPYSPPGFALIIDPC